MDEKPVPIHRIRMNTRKYFNINKILKGSEPQKSWIYNNLSCGANRYSLETMMNWGTGSKRKIKSRIDNKKKIEKTFTVQNI